MFISLDLETTGFDPIKDKIIEFGAVKFDLKKEHERLTFLINPGITLPQIITHITKIKDRDLKDAPSFHEKIAEIQNFIGDLPIIGHNIQFDIDFLTQNGLEIKNPLYDTYQLSSILIPDLHSYSLEVLTHALNLKHAEKHRALDDSIAAMELFLKLLEKLEGLDPKVLEEIKKLVQKSDWPLKNLIQDKISRSTKKTRSKAKITPAKLASNYKSILDETANALFENTDSELKKDLLEKANNETLISVPSEILLQLHNETNANIIDSYKNYLSLKKLEQFKAKSHFENHEITALIKLLIWQRQSQTGLINEVNFQGQEKTLITKFNLDMPEDHPDFAKPLTKKTLCSHEYLVEQGASNKELIILDFHKFMKTLHRKESKFLKFDHVTSILNSLKELFPNNETVNTLIDKSVILFGLIGILFEKYHDPTSYTLRYTADEGTKNSREWEQIEQNITNLIELSHGLSEIKNEESLSHLIQWKQKLSDLDNIFRHPELDKNMVWIENDQNFGLMVQKAPFSTSEKLNEILESAKNYKLIDANFDLLDDGAFIKKLYDLNSELKIHKTLGERENLTIELIDNLDENDQNAITNFLIGYFEANKKTVALIFNSKKQLQAITLKLSPKNIPIISQTTGSAGKVKSLFNQEQAECLLLITQHTWEQLEGHDEIDTLIIHKLPFDPPSDPELIINSKKFDNPFDDLQVKSAVLKLKNMISRLDTRTKKEVIILDNRITQRNYSKVFLENLKTLGALI